MDLCSALPCIICSIACNLRCCFAIFYRNYYQAPSIDYHKYSRVHFLSLRYQNLIFFYHNSINRKWMCSWLKHFWIFQRCIIFFCAMWIIQPTVNYIEYLFLILIFLNWIFITYSFSIWVFFLHFSLTLYRRNKRLAKDWFLLT